MSSLEQGILAAILETGPSFARVADTLEADSFETDAHKAIWEAFDELALEGSPIDPQTVQAHLGETGNGSRVPLGYVDELWAHGGDPENIAWYAAKLVKEQSRRQMAAQTKLAAERMADGENQQEVMSELQAKMLSFSNRQSDGGDVVWAEALATTAKRMELESSGQRRDVKTGFVDLDRIIIGMEPEDLVILAASTSVGKTALAVNIAANACRTGKAVYLASLEMSQDSLTRRILAREGLLRHSDLRRPEDAGSEFWPAIAKVQDATQHWKLTLGGVSGLSTAQLLTKARRSKSRSGLDLVIVDYLQLMQGKGDSLYHQVTNVSHGLKAVSRALGVPVLALSQLSRDAVKENRAPNLADLRESGAIEQDADTVILMQAKDIDTERREVIVELNVAKQRNGATGKLNLRFSQEYLRFGDSIGEGQ